MTEHVEACSTEFPQSQPSDFTLDQLAEARYLKALDGLIADAAESKRMHVLADGLAWTVARIALQYGPAATGDMLRRIGGYIGSLEERGQAAEEAQQARQEGRLPN